MALFDFLKKKEEVEKAKPVEQKKPVKKTGEVKVEKKSVAPKVQAKNNFSYDIVKGPHISERATDLAEKKNQFTFRVVKGANKTEVKKAVEGIYGVNVLSVNMIKIPAKKRRLGRTQGFKKGYVKAVVRIKEGQKIEIL